MIASSSLIFILLSTVFAAFASYYLRKGLKKTNLKLLLRTPQIYLGVFLYGVATLLGILAYRSADLVVVFPISSLTYVWVLLLSKYKLGEELNFYKIFGMALIALGAFLLVI